MSGYYSYERIHQRSQETKSREYYNYYGENETLGADKIEEIVAEIVRIYNNCDKKIKPFILQVQKEKKEEKRKEKVNKKEKYFIVI
jgi:hypothetical protein